MATVIRFYMPSTGASAVDPAYSASWGDADPAANDGRLAAVTARIDSAMGWIDGYFAGAETAKLGFRQYVTAAQAAHDWTTADSIKFQALGLKESGISGHGHFIIRVVSSDGSTFRGTLYEGDGLNDFHTVFPGRNYSIGGAGASVQVQNAVSMQADDRLVIEIGYNGTATAASNVYFRIGDDSATELPENETDTDDTKTPWIQFTLEEPVTDLMLPLTGVSG